MRLVLACLTIGPLAGAALVHLQARLERWDYDRHADD